MLDAIDAEGCCVDLFVLPRGDREHGVTDDALGFVPVRQVREGVAADDEVELVVQALGGERCQRVGGVRRTLAGEFDVADAEGVVVFDGELQHREAVGSVGDRAVRLPPRFARGHEQHEIEVQRGARVLGEHEVSDMDGVECTAEDAYAHGGATTDSRQQTTEIAGPRLLSVVCCLLFLMLPPSAVRCRQSGRGRRGRRRRGGGR